MASLISYDDELQKAIQLSILDLSFEQQCKLAQQESEREENRRQQVAAELSRMSFEEQLRLAEEMSLKDSPSTPSKSFFAKHFQELSIPEPDLIFPEQQPQQVIQINGKRNHRGKKMSSKATDHSSSDSDSGFGSEDKDLRMALQMSQDPSEQNSSEMRDILLALQMSERDGSSVDLSNGTLWTVNQDKRPSDELWLYEDEDNSNRCKVKKPVRSYQELNDQILLNQLEERSAEPANTIQPLTPEELESLRPFLEVDEDVEVLSRVTSDGVKTLDEIEAELSLVERKKKKKKKTSPSPTNSGSTSPNGFNVVARRTETGARPKTIQRIGSQPSARLSPVHSHLSQSPRSQPRNSPLSWSSVTTDGCAHFRNPCGRPRGSLRPIIVDGNNVAYQHGKNDRFSAKGLQIVFDYFSEKFGYSSQDIVIVHKPGGFKSAADNEIIESLYKIDVLIKTPRRFAGNKLIYSDDDLFVLNMAKEKGGIVVSLDHFRDAHKATTDPEIRDIIENRVLQFSFKGDEIFFPNDPMGPGGPTLDQFLRF